MGLSRNLHTLGAMAVLCRGHRRSAAAPRRRGSDAPRAGSRVEDELVDGCGPVARTGCACMQMGHTVPVYAVVHGVDR